MKKLTAVIAALGLSLATVGYAQDSKPADAVAQEKTEKAEKAEKVKPTDVKLESEKDKAAYAIGVDIGQNLKQVLPEDFNYNILIAAMRHVIDDKELLLTDDEKNEVMMKFQQEMQQQQMEKMHKAAAENKTKGEEFLTANKAKEGVKETETGLQYQMITEGSGDSPTDKDLVTIHYRGQFLDGEVFDETYDNNEPYTAPAGGFVPGFTEGLKLMKKGGKAKFFIPGDLGYGPMGNARGGIDPNTTLIFDVELLDVKKAGAEGEPGMEGMQLPPGHPNVNE